MTDRVSPTLLLFISGRRARAYVYSGRTVDYGHDGDKIFAWRSWYKWLDCYSLFFPENAHAYPVYSRRLVQEINL